MTRWQRFLSWLRNETPPLFDARWAEQPHVYMDHGAEEWADDVDFACGIWNAHIGAKFLVFEGAAPPGMEREFFSTGHGLRGAVLVTADNVNHGKSHTEVYRFRDHSGVERIASAHIMLRPYPRERPQWPVPWEVLHETGHVLGIGHARHPKSIMWGEMAQSEGKILSSETKHVEPYAALVKGVSA